MLEILRHKVNHHEDGACDWREMAEKKTSHQFDSGAFLDVRASSLFQVIRAGAHRASYRSCVENRDIENQHA